MLPENVRLSHLATAVGMTVEDLLDVSRDPSVWYRPSFKKRTRRKKRNIDPPTRIGKRWLKRLADFLGAELPVHSCAHGSVKNRCNFTAAGNHLGDRPILTRDARNCFPSVDRERFFAELIALGLQHDVAIVLTNILLYRGRLPIGSPASNAALNLFFYRTDETIRKAAAIFGGRYTRYCDDLVVSVANIADATKAVDLLEGALAALGLTVNEVKREKNGLQDLTVERRVNGVRVDSARGTRVPSDWEDDLLARAKQYALSAQSCNLDALPTLARRRRKLEGRLNYAGQAQLSPVVGLRRILGSGDNFIAHNLFKYGIKINPSNWWAKNQYLDQGARIKEQLLKERSEVDKLRC